MQAIIKNKKFILFKNNLLAIIYLSYSIIDLRIENNNYIKLILFLLWFIFAIIEVKSFVFLKNKSMALLFSFICFVFLNGIIKGDLLHNIKMTTALLLIYSPIIVFCFYFHKKDYQSLYIISTISIIVMIFCSLVSAYLFNYDKNIPIKLAQNSYEYGILAVGEVYGLVNALSVLSSVLFVLFLSKKFKYSYERLFVLFLLLIFFVAIYTSRSSLTVLITFFSYVLALLCTSWFTNKGKAFGKKIIGLLVISFVLIVLIFAKEYIGETIMFISKSKSSKLLSRIYSIGESMVGIVSKNSQTGFLSRFDLIFTSIKTFLTNPFVGIYHVSGGNYFKLLDLGVGDHSQWFDMLASYGLLGVFPLFYLIITNLRVYYKNSKICHCWTFIIFLLGLVNPYICFTTIHIQFLIIPTLFFYKKILSFKDFNSYFI